MEEYHTDPRRIALVADLLTGHEGSPSEFEVLMWIRWADMVLFALEEYRSQERTAAVAVLERLIRLADENCDDKQREKARDYLARHTTAGRPSLSQEDAKRLLRTDPSGNLYPTEG